MKEGNIIVVVSVSGSGVIAGYVAFDVFYKAYQMDYSSCPGDTTDTYAYFMQNIFPLIVSAIDASIEDLSSSDVAKEVYNGMLDSSVVPIGISISGQIDSEGSLISASSIVKGMLDTSIPLKKLLEQHYHYNQLFIINNVSAAAFYLAGDERLSDRVYLVLHIGSGVGSKVFDATTNNLIIDKNFYSGEIGHSHVSINKDGFPINVLCDCGALNHMASFVLERGLSSLAKEYLHKQIDIIEALDLLHCNEEFSVFYFDIVSEAICQTVVPIVLATGLNKVVITGNRFYENKSKTLKQRFIDALLRRLKEYLSPYYHIDDSFLIDMMTVIVKYMN